MAEPILKIENLEAGYGEMQVLWGVSLGVETGQLTTIIGANGAGKTTTLRASMGIINPKAGRIILKGEDVTRLPPMPRLTVAWFSFLRAGSCSPT